MSFTNTFETHVLNYMFTTSSVTRPTQWYLALFTSNPAEDASGSEVSTSGTAYTRKAVTFTVSGNAASNSAEIEFPTATASFGTVTHFGVFNASSSGTLIAYGSLSTSKTIDTGDVLRVAASNINLTLD